MDTAPETQTQRRKTAEAKAPQPEKIFVSYIPEQEAPPRAAGFGIAINGQEFIRFEPGVNVFSPTQWESVKGMSHILDRLNIGAIKVLSEDPSEEEELPSEIHGLKESIALQAVHESRSVEQLESWKAREQGKRPRLVQAITRQIEAIKRGAI